MAGILSLFWRSDPFTLKIIDVHQLQQVLNFQKLGLDASPVDPIDDARVREVCRQMIQRLPSCEGVYTGGIWGKHRFTLVQIPEGVSLRKLIVWDKFRKASVIPNDGRLNVVMAETSTRALADPIGKEEEKEVLQQGEVTRVTIRRTGPTMVTDTVYTRFHHQGAIHRITTKKLSIIDDVQDEEISPGNYLFLAGPRVDTSLGWIPSMRNPRELSEYAACAECRVPQLAELIFAMFAATLTKQDHPALTGDSQPLCCLASVAENDLRNPIYVCRPPSGIAQPADAITAGELLLLHPEQVHRLPSYENLVLCRRV